MLFKNTHKSNSFTTKIKQKSTNITKKGFHYFNTLLQLIVFDQENYK